MQRRSFMAFSASAILGSAALATSITPVLADEAYPTRPITMVLPYAAGGPADIFGRQLAARMSQDLGQNIVVEARGGAGGTIGTGYVANADADGYTLLLGATGSHVVNPLTWKDPPFDPIDDFVPIALLTRQPMVLAVNPELGVDTIDELVALLEANPGKYSYASAGTGALGHLTAELFLREAGELDVAHAAYKGGAPALVDVMAGHVPFVWEVLSGVVPHERAGKLKVLAVAGTERSEALPDVPTAAEAGLEAVVAETNFFLLAPAGTPQPIVDRLADVAADAMGDTELQAALEKNSITPVVDSNPAHAEAFIEDSINLWRPVVDSLGLQRN